MNGFPLAPGSYVYRALRLTPERQTGYDVFALQTALNAVEARLILDGHFGPLTGEAVKTFQAAREMVADGIAGVATQQRLTEIICRKVRRDLGLPKGIPYGHAEHESSCWLGNHTPPYSNGSRDCGVVQRNTQYTPMAEGFNVPDSIRACGERVLAYHAKYRGWGVEERRAWELACGSWNAPSWVDRLARGEDLPAEYRQKIESYIDAVTAYLDV
jgi:hypothetical protein